MLLSALQVLNQRDSQERTALMLACQAGAVGCVRLLLAAGADPILLDGLQNSCLHHAARSGASDVLELLLGDSTCVKTASGDRVLLRRASVIDHRRRPVRVSKRAKHPRSAGMESETLGSRSPQCC